MNQISSYKINHFYQINLSWIQFEALSSYVSPLRRQLVFYSVTKRAGNISVWRKHFSGRLNCSASATPGGSEPKTVRPYVLMFLSLQNVYSYVDWRWTTSEAQSKFGRTPPSRLGPNDVPDRTALKIKSA